MQVGRVKFQQKVHATKSKTELWQFCVEQSNLDRLLIRVVLSCVVLCCLVLFCVVLCCLVLFCVVLCCIVFYCVVF